MDSYARGNVWLHLLLVILFNSLHLKLAVDSQYHVFANVTLFPMHSTVDHGLVTVRCRYFAHVVKHCFWAIVLLLASFPRLACVSESRPPELASMSGLPSKACSNVIEPSASPVVGALVEQMHVLPTCASPPPRRQSQCLEETPTKRLRLRGKLALGNPLECAKPLEVNGFVIPLDYVAPDFPSLQEWIKLGFRNQGQRLLQYLRSCYISSMSVAMRSEASQFTQNNTGYRDTQSGGRRLWTQLEDAKKRHFMVEWSHRVEMPQYIAKRFQELYDRKRNGGTWQKSVLLTYNGDWGALQTSEFKDLHGLPLDDLVTRLRTDNSVQQLFDEFQLYGKKVQEKVKWCDIALSLEVCTTTLKENGSVRLHGHIFLRSDKPFRLPVMEDLGFSGSLPHMRHMGDKAAYAVSKNSWCGYFYLACPKAGVVHRWSNKEPFKDYLVQGQWVMNLLQSGKLSTVDAKPLLMRCCHNVARYVKELEVLEEQEELRVIKEAKESALRVLGPTDRPFRVLPEVCLWEEQYGVARHRYKFLVLNGPTKLGKTQFARNLTPPGKEFYLVNCAAGSSPDLRSFRYAKHGLILFDEITPQQVISEKLLFQGSASEVQLGTSSTNCYSYSVFLWRTRLVMASNTWSRLLSTMEVDDQEWIHNNSMYVEVSSPLWVGE